MLLDTIHGTIDRRVLLNYRLDPDVLERVLPRPFRPKLFAGVGIGGVCMIRFAHLRPRHVPRWFGLGSENAAHRIAVEWTQDGESREGVFIPRRDTNSAFNRVLGGRVFPGIFSGARFDAQESASAVAIRIVRGDGGIEVACAGHVVDALPSGTVFPSVSAAADFFSLGATGYSATRDPAHFHGMELHSLNWSVTALAVDEAQSAFFEDANRFPAGSATLDCALLMRGIEHEWHSRPDLYVAPNGDGFTTRRVTP
jgi:hypothetical protein